MITILTYLSIAAGGLLVLLLLLSMIGGLDVDAELDAGMDADGGAGWLKSGLTFLSVGAWTVRVFLLADFNPYVAVIGGGAAGAVSVYLLSLVVRFLLRQEANVNYSIQEAVWQSGRVYLKIPPEGTGLIQVELRGSRRQFKARSADGKILPTGTPIRVESVEDGVAVVIREPA